MVEKRIFLLTDGVVRNPKEVIGQAGLLNEVTRVHTFGIGERCDKTMVVETAKSGRGSYSMVQDNSNQLNGLVVKALARAFEPSLKGCSMHWDGENEKLDEVFRNQTVCRTAILSKD